MSSSDVDEAIRQAELALAALSQSPAPPGTDPDRAVASFRAACHALDAVGPRAIEVLARAIASPNPLEFSRAQSAARILAELVDPDAAGALLRAALAHDPASSFRAWFALRNLRRSPAHFAEVAGVAMLTAPTEVEQRRRDLLADALGRQLHAERYAEVAAWASSQRPYVRQTIVKALARWGGPAAVAHLETALADGDRIVASWAAFGLLFEVEHADALRVLVASRRAKQAKLRAEVVGLLGLLPHPAAVKPVIESTEDAATGVRLAAIVGAGNAGVRQSLLALSALLDHKSAAVAEQAAAILRDLLGHDPGYTWKARRLSAVSVERVRKLCREIHDQWAPGERHVRGALATAARFADALTGFDTGAASWSLVGMAGQRFGLDPAADVIANWDAIQQVRAWATTQGGALRAGAFYLRGEIMDASALD